MTIFSYENESNHSVDMGISVPAHKKLATYLCKNDGSKSFEINQFLGNVV